MHQSRNTKARNVRGEAAEVASRRPPVKHCNNKEEYEYRNPDTNQPSHLANFTKGLPHDPKTGLLLNPVDYKLFVVGIQSGDPADFAKTPLGPAGAQGAKARIPGNPTVEAITAERFDRRGCWQSEIAKSVKLPDKKSPVERGARVRAWESAGAGSVLDLQGPDAQAVTMPPAPRLDSDELEAEVAEVYAMALLRDVPFAQFPLCQGMAATPQEFDDAFDMLSSMHWFDQDRDDSNDTAEERSRFRQLESSDQTFRGTTPGERVGPYLSQFLLLGNNALGTPGDLTERIPQDRIPAEGFITYGAIGIQQKVRVATEKKDYMTNWDQFIDVQNGADLRGLESYVSADKFDQGHRFIATPRDLATYVHYDALYEAYLNACLSLLASGAPFDRGIPFLESDTFDKQQGFAHFGGPHILTLVCEAATRALKAVRYQKFNIHRRLRPEAVGGLIDRWMTEDKSLQKGVLSPIRRLMEGDGSKDKGLKNLQLGRSNALNVVRAFNRNNNNAHFKTDGSAKADSYLLPMAFPEGSPMHPAYGAGHGTVAGACVTILKAYFDHGWTVPAWTNGSQAIAYVPEEDGSCLNTVNLSAPLTVEGELNKLAANIAIGRNWAGVHYYSDYIESMRLGEEIALGMLEEQKLTYPENFTMTVPLFDGGAIQI